MATTTPTQFDAVIDALNLKELPEDEQSQLLLDIGDIIFQGSLVRLIERMDAGTRDVFTVLLDKGASEEEIEDFIMKNVPHADKAIEETVRDLASDILSATKK